MSGRFEAMRARWEAHRNDNSPTIPLLHNIENTSTATLSKMDHKSNTLPGPSKRFPSNFGGMFNKPITTIRNKALSRASRHASNDIQLGHRRQSMSGKSFGQTSWNVGKENRNLTKSQTMSFLPVPAKSNNRKAPSPAPIRPKQHVKAVSETRVPTPPRISFSRPSGLPRSTTHPSLGTHAIAGGRRASEYARRTSSKWPRTHEEVRPLLRTPLIESPMLRTPDTDDEWIRSTIPSYIDPPSGSSHHVVSSPMNTMWSSLNTPRHPSISTIKKPDSAGLQYSSAGRTISSSPLRSPREIRHHQLLQPIQPVTPPKDTMLCSMHEITPVTALPPASHCHLPSSPSRPMFANRSSMQRPAPLVLTPLMPPATCTVDTAQPNAYWSGRFISLNDKFLNECFDVDLHPTNEDEVASSNNSKLSLVHTSLPARSVQNDELQRALKIFEKLENICTTDEARRSLIIFRNMYAIRTKLLELKIDLPATPKIQEQQEERLGSSVGSSEVASAGSRKMSFMGRLRGRKSSGKSILSLRD